MKKETEEKLARSLTARTAELLPFLPYLLQDFWELGSSPEDIVMLLEKYVPLSKNSKILDLACGKGAVSVKIAKRLNVNVRGVDLLPDFIAAAGEKAKKWRVESLCRFECADANEAVVTERDYDCVVFGAAGNILGSPKETLEKLRETVKPQGFILMDEAYLPVGSGSENVRIEYEYLTREQWLGLFEESGLRLLEEISYTGERDFSSDNEAIAARAQELAAKHPEKRALFEGYVQSQLDECTDLNGSVVGAAWILQKA
ncbi:MAG: methyltransferase domain-containing protein [Clostridiales bacterium]|nr:methyltransferase domain-containing protein [Clostridiales bacterium]